MPDDVLAYGVATMKKYRLVDGGDARTLGILAITESRWKQTFDFMVDAGMLNRETDCKRAYALEYARRVKVLP